MMEKIADKSAEEYRKIILTLEKENSALKQSIREEVRQKYDAYKKIVLLREELDEKINK